MGGHCQRPVLSGPRQLAGGSTDPLLPQVQVGSTPQDQRIVGYIACTHLHAPQGRAATRLCFSRDGISAWCLAGVWGQLHHPVSVLLPCRG